MKNPNIIRVGDYIRIINPELFVRCGYPLTIKVQQEDIEKQFGDDIRLLINKVGLQYTSFAENKTFNEISQSLAYYMVKQKKFGGNERKIYTKTCEELIENVYKVINIKIVKTGIYCVGGYSGYEGQEWEPASLENPKTHKILELDMFHEFPFIEDKNVKKTITTKIDN
jgi:hypothetical protein